MSISSRHQGDLGGRLVPFERAQKVPVSIIVETPELVSTQHLAWMLVNLLVRLEGYVGTVSVCCPKGVPLSPFVIPWRRGTGDLREALIAEGSHLELAPVTADQVFPCAFVVGPGDKPADSGWRVHGDGWCGGVSKHSVASTRESALPFGPYIAACLAAAELFKQCRLKPEFHEPFDTCFFSSWSTEASNRDLQDGPHLANLRLAFDLAGVGAVGNSFLHTLAAIPETHVEAGLWDSDAKGVDDTNLNRYVLFGRRHLGGNKPDAAVELLKRLGWNLEPHNSVFSDCPSPRSRVVSAVDTNIARESVQLKYPARIISGSTQELRAEVLRCGPPGTGACLRCFNPPELPAADDVLLELLRRLPPDELAAKCCEVGIPFEAAQAWLREPKCGDQGVRLLEVVRTPEARPDAFAVGFVSVLAGVLLAGELVKDAIGADVPLNNSCNRLNFQFLNPLSSINSADRLGRDPQCPSCPPDQPKTLIWKKRFDALAPLRT